MFELGPEPQGPLLQANARWQPLKRLRAKTHQPDTPLPCVLFGSPPGVHGGQLPMQTTGRLQTQLSVEIGTAKGGEGSIAATSFASPGSREAGLQAISFASIAHDCSPGSNGAPGTLLPTGGIQGAQFSREGILFGDASFASTPFAVCRKIPLGGAGSASDHIAFAPPGAQESFACRKIPQGGAEFASDELVVCRKIPLGGAESASDDIVSSLSGAQESVASRKIPLGGAELASDIIISAPYGAQESFACRKIPQGGAKCYLASVFLQPSGFTCSQIPPGGAGSGSTIASPHHASVEGSSVNPNLGCLRMPVASSSDAFEPALGTSSSCFVPASNFAGTFDCPEFRDDFGTYDVDDV